MHVSASGSAIAANLAPTRMRGTAETRLFFSPPERDAPRRARYDLKNDADRSEMVNSLLLGSVDERARRRLTRLVGRY